VVSVLYLTNQGDILATAVPGFPVWDLGGLIGSTAWGLWVAVLGVTVLLRPPRPADAPLDQSSAGAPTTIPSPRSPVATASGAEAP